MNGTYWLMGCALLLAACSDPEGSSPAAEVASAPSPIAPLTPEPASEPAAVALPTIPPTASNAGDSLAADLVRYVQAVAVCDHLTPGLLDAAKAELRSAMGTSAWTQDMEVTTDSFRNGEGSRMAAQMQAAVASGQVSLTRMRSLCGEDIADNKSMLIAAMNAFMEAHR
jgi:hypothetical protein